MTGPYAELLGMRALTIRQPWASLIALGVKTVETRSWSTSYRGPLAIHAAKHKPWWYIDAVSGAYRNRDGAPWHDDLDRFCTLAENAKGHEFAVWDERSLGAVVATCELVDVVPIVDDPAARNCVDIRVDGARPERPALRMDSAAGEVISDLGDQFPYGDFTPGRYAWLLADIKPLNVPVPAKGRRGLWTFSVPA